jgi:hypothetical protein
MHSLSVIEPISAALRRTRRVLFEPFLLSKWLRLGFCAFLMGSLQPVGFGGGSNTDDSGSSSGVGTDRFEDAIAWIPDHLLPFLAGATLLLVLIVGIGLLVTWLSSRGQFMLLDGVVRNRGAIKAPWHEFRREANSLFRFRVGFGILSLLVLLLILAVASLIGMAAIGKALSILSLVVLALLALLLLTAWIVVVGGVSLLLADFVVPLMYLHRIPVLPAWRHLTTSLWRQHRGSLALYVLARLLIHSAVITLAGLATLLTCFLPILPYLGSVILLPFTVFQLSYPLAFLQQLGPDYTFFPTESPAAT